MSNGVTDRRIEEEEWGETEDYCYPYYPCIPLPPSELPPYPATPLPPLDEPCE